VTYAACVAAPNTSMPTTATVPLIDRIMSFSLFRVI
jgi:hypothetical protein